MPCSAEVLLTVPLAQCWTAASARRLQVPVVMTEKEAIIAELMVLKLKDAGVGWIFMMFKKNVFLLRLIDLVDGEFGC